MIADIITRLNDLIWSMYVLVPFLVVVSLYFTFKTKGVQFRLLPHTVKNLGKSTEGGEGGSVSSFQAFAVGLASRIGTGNLAGVATALVVGGPGAIFWMWVIALIGSANSFVESTLAQVFKVRDKEVGFRGGPAYYMKYGLKKSGVAIFFATMLISIYAFGIIALQSNTINTAITSQVAEWVPSVNTEMVSFVAAIAVAAITALIIFGGAKRVVNASTGIVSVMAILYLSMGFIVLVTNLSAIPEMFSAIISQAFVPSALVAGGLGQVISTGFKRGLFSNEAGMGTAPNASGAATVKHPVTQGSIQALGVFVDTLAICSATAFVILISGVTLDPNVDAILITKEALQITLGNWAGFALTVCIFMFAFTTILGIFFYAQSNYEFLIPSNKGLKFYKVFIVVTVFIGSVAQASIVWILGDLATGMMALTNLAFMLPIAWIAFLCLKDFESQLRNGVEDPVFDASKYRELDQFDLEIWDQTNKK